MAWLTEEMLREHWPKASNELIRGIMDHASADLKKAEIINTMRLAHFMAQISHESGGGRVLIENLWYSTTKRLVAVFPSYFPDEKSAEPYVAQPILLANKVYNGRMGNQPDSDDGWNYRGRGLIQITGRNNYREMGRLSGLPLEAGPPQAALVDNVLRIACAFWTYRTINPIADADDLLKVTKKINGGLNGLEDRKVWLAKWKKSLKVS